MPKFQPQQPGEVPTTRDSFHLIRSANKLLKAHGLAIKLRTDGQAYLRLERLPMDDGRSHPGEGPPPGLNQ